MKKYLLTALLGVFGFIGAFVSANSSTFECPIDGNSPCYIPDSITFSDSTRLDLSSFTNYDCDEYCTFDIVNNDSDNFLSCEFSYSNYDNDLQTSLDGYSNDGSREGYCNFEAGTYEVNHSDGNYFTSITVNYGNSGDSSGSLLPGGEGSLSGIITGLSITLNEFIPYLVYVGLGVLGAVIGFFAIKWLMNRIRAKVLGTFSGGRRR